MARRGTGILAQTILCFLKLQTFFFFAPVLCQDIAYIIDEKNKITQKKKQIKKEESLDKEKPCNVVLNI